MSVNVIHTFNPKTKTTTFGIPTHYRGALLSKRDMMETQHSVKIYFPRNGMLPGGYQIMNVVGPKYASQKIQTLSIQIIQTAQDQYSQFRERQRERNARMTPQFYAPNPTQLATPQPTQSSRFGVLEVDAPEPKQEWPSLSTNPSFSKPKKAVWVQAGETTTSEHITIQPVVLSGSWGDESDDE